MKILFFIFFLSFAYTNFAMESHVLTLSDFPKKIMYKIAACSEPEDRNTCMYVSKYVKNCFALEDSFGKKNYEIIAHSPLKLGERDRTFFMIYYCDEGNEKIVKNLLENGISANCNAHGISSLSIVLQKGNSHSCIRDLLLQYGANRNNALATISPFAMAVYKGDMKTVKWYCENNFGPIESLRVNKVPILCVAALRHANMVSYLLSSVTYKSFLVEFLSKTGSNSFHFAARGGNIHAMELLLERRITHNISEGNDQGKRPLHHAAKSGKFNAVQFLVERGAEINAQDREGHTPLNYAYNLKIMDYLFNHGAHIDIKDHGGNMILHRIICQKRSIAYIQWLIEKGSPINAEGNYGKTPLHYAAEANYGDAVKLLIAYGAEKDIKNACGKIPLDYALEHKELDYPISLLNPDIENKEETVSAFMKSVKKVFNF